MICGNLHILVLCITLGHENYYGIWLRNGNENTQLQFVVPICANSKLLPMSLYEATGCQRQLTHSSPMLTLGSEYGRSFHLLVGYELARSKTIIKSMRVSVCGMVLFGTHLCKKLNTHICKPQTLN